MRRATISQLKSRLSEHLRAAEAGETIEVMDRARPIAWVVPIDRGLASLEVVPADRSFASVRNVRLPPASIKITSLQALQRDRGTR
jgi:prevent-host-death family protein